MQIDVEEEFENCVCLTSPIVKTSRDVLFSLMLFHSLLDYYELAVENKTWCLTRASSGETMLSDTKEIIIYGPLKQNKHLS